MVSSETEKHAIRTIAPLVIEMLSVKWSVILGLSVSVKKGSKERGKNVPKSKILVKNVLDSLDAYPMPPMDQGVNAFAIEDMLEMG